MSSRHRSQPRLRRLPLFLALSFALPLAALADDNQSQLDTHKPVDLNTVEVHANPLTGTAEDLARPVEVLTGERLDEAKANSLGETVGKLPGVQSSYFGPGVGRPIVRGFDGARVQVLSDGLGSGDVSTVSADHAVSIEPFLADQIEVLKGPATLLYGSGAIGGAVNVIDGRIPEAVTGQPLQGRAELRGNTVSDEKTGMARLDATSASSNVVFHFDAVHRETGDYDIPGFAESAERLAEDGETPDPASRGVLPNSFVRTDSGALGVSWVGERGFRRRRHLLFDTRYGVPGHAHEHEEEEEEPAPGEEEHEEAGVHIGLDQRRYELRGGLNDLGAFKSLRAKVARTDYTHTEFEGDVVGTVFDNTSTEARVELVHQPVAGWDGAFGMQWGQREFAAIGEEAFIPTTQGDDAGLFWIGERAFGPVKVELGARPIATRSTWTKRVAIGPDRDFNTTSVSAALKWEISDAFHLQLRPRPRAALAHGRRAVFQRSARGHASFEIGTPTLDVETANRAELGLNWHSGPFKPMRRCITSATTISSTSPTPASAGRRGTRSRLWSQGDARFNGAEGELDWTFADNASGAWSLRVFGDIVRGELNGSGHARGPLRVRS